MKGGNCDRNDDKWKKWERNAGQGREGDKSTEGVKEKGERGRRMKTGRTSERNGKRILKKEETEIKARSDKGDENKDVTVFQ